VLAFTAAGAGLLAGCGGGSHSSKSAGASTTGAKVVDQQARITLDPHGTAVQELKSKFNQALPVNVTVTYTLDGKPISGKHIGRQSGTLEIRYKLANVTSESVPTCFEGFDGTQQHLTVKAQVPIVASLSLTVPSQATSFEAPGASLSSARKGVSVGWTPSLFEPLGPPVQTFTVKMKMTHVSIPKVSLYLFTIDPRTLTGSVPAKTATAVGKASAGQAKIVGSLQEGLDTLQKRVSSFAAPPSPKASGAKATPSRSVSSAFGGGQETRDTSLAHLSASLMSFLRINAALSHQTAALLVLTARVRWTRQLSPHQGHDSLRRPW
jgi:hypothetical protein